MWGNSIFQSKKPVSESRGSHEPAGANTDAPSVASTDASTLVPAQADARNQRRTIQPTGFDVSLEAIERAAARREQDGPVDTSYMSEADKAKLRAKGINPELKAEMDAKVYGKRGGKLKLALLGNAWG